MADTGWSQHPLAHLLMLMGFHQRHQFHLPSGIARHHHGQLVLKRHQFLEDPTAWIHPHQQRFQRGAIEHPFGSLAVVAACHRLGHGRKLHVLRQSTTGAHHLRQIAPARARQIQPLQQQVLAAFVHQLLENGRRGLKFQATLFQRSDGLEIHPLVLKADRITALSKLCCGSAIGCGADHHLIHKLASRITGA